MSAIKLEKLAKAKGWQLQSVQYPDNKIKIKLTGNHGEGEDPKPHNPTGMGDTVDEAAAQILEALEIGPRDDLST